MTAIIGKKEPARWEGLLRGGAKIKNMAQWVDMDIKWAPELKAFLKKQRGSEGVDEDMEEADREESETKKMARCKADNKKSVFRSTLVKELCTSWFPVNEKTKKAERWLVMFYGPKELKCEERGPECIKLKDFWSVLSDRLRDMNEG